MQPTPERKLDQATFIAIRDRIASYSGIYLDESRRRSLGQVIARRMARHRLGRWEEYLSLLDSPGGPAEMAALLEEVVNTETAFFRNPRHFRALAEVVLPELDRARPPNTPLRLWSAGCSTGQEPYSIAITVAELFGLPPRRPVEILATDISTRALDYTREGLYTPKQIERVEPSYQERYFRPQGGGFRVHPALRELVRPYQLNLVAAPFPPFFSAIDVIFCRNVTIYFQVETSRDLMGNLHRCLHEGGYLFIGFSETLWQIFDAFERVEAGGAFFYRKGPANAPRRPELRQAPPRPHSVPGGSSVERPLHLGERGGQEKRVRPGDTVPVQSAPPEQDRARERYQRGMASLRDGDYEQAIRAFQAALEVEPNLVEGYCGIAQVYANQGRYEEALQSCQRALELDDLAEEAYLLRGLIYRQRDRLDEAVADLKRAVYLNPSSPTAHFHLGDTLLALKDYPRALRAFQRTWRTLAGQPEHAVIDGVPVYLLRQACRRHIEALSRSDRAVGVS